jgi:3-hexulose-6-phosphate synthase
MLLQIALDKPEHLSLLPRLSGLADIVEIGTPVLKRFGLSAVATAREFCPDTLIMADTKTVDGGQLEAKMVFSAGASFMTVLSSASPATHQAVHVVATEYGTTVVVDTITESGKAELIPPGLTFPESFAYVAVHAPSDTRLAGDNSTSHIDAVREMHKRGFRVSLAGGIGPNTLDAVLAVEPEVLVVGSAITEANNPEEIARWIKSKLHHPNLGWPWDAK